MSAIAFAIVFFASIGGELPLSHHDYSLISLSVVATLGVVVIGATLFTVLRRKPSIEVEVNSLITDAINSLEVKFDQKLGILSSEVHRLNEERKTNITVVIQRMDEQQALIDRKLDSQSHTISEGFKDIHRALGRIEGTIAK